MSLLSRMADCLPDDIDPKALHVERQGDTYYYCLDPRYIALTAKERKAYGNIRSDIYVTDGED